MYLSHISLSQYRNYKEIKLEFSDKINVFLGQNAQGKTNLMESIYVLALAKSHRTNNDKDLISWSEDYGKIYGEVVKRNGIDRLELLLSKKGKKAKCNYIEQAKLSQYIGKMNVVMFAPEDLHLVKGSPQMRRKFIDMELGQISPIYIHNLVQFQKILQQRNHYLKSIRGKSNIDEVMLDILDEQLVHFGAFVINKRVEFLNQLEKWAKPIHLGISMEKEVLTLKYKTIVDDVCNDIDLPKIKDIYIEKLKSHRRKDIDRGTTLIGPHRDDFEMFVNDYNVQSFGSQGQQRTTALSLKLAEIELIHEIVQEYPILLLDDVLSELDDFRQTHLLNTIGKKVQTFVTTTSIKGIEHEALQKSKTFYVENGTIDGKD